MSTPRSRQMRSEMIDVMDIFVDTLIAKGLDREEACKLIRHATHVIQNKRLPAVEGVTELGDANGEVGTNELYAVGV